MLPDISTRLGGPFRYAKGGQEGDVRQIILGHGTLPFECIINGQKGIKWNIISNLCSF